MEGVTEGVNNLQITDSSYNNKKNRIQVSNTKKPLFFYVNLAKVNQPHFLHLHVFRYCFWDFPFALCLIVENGREDPFLPNAKATDCCWFSLECIWIY